MSDNYESQTAEIDKSLLEAGVKFLPWIGKDYEDGFKGRRLLILGESHYDTWGKGDVCHILDSKFSRLCVKEAVRRDEKAANFYRYIEQVLL